MVNNRNKEIGKIIKQQRIMLPLTLKELSEASGVSSSHLGRIERGERFPSADILRKIAKPLGFGEAELFASAGYLSPSSAGTERGKEDVGKHLDPYVAHVLAQESVEVQRTVIAILTIFKNLAKH